jgi:hypothetical protein
MSRYVSSWQRMGVFSALCGALLCTAPPSVLAQVFAKNESQVTPNIDLFDLEFNQKRGKITWVDSRGRLWVAGVDRTTGMFKPANGQGVLVDPDALTSKDLQIVGNGPEWLLSAGPDRIVYTKFLAGRVHKLVNARIAMAEQDASTGKWSVRYLSDQPRYRPYASADQDDPAPRISYVDPSGNAYWRDADNPASEAIVPWMEASRVLALRFAAGERAAVMIAEFNGVAQVARYWLDTQKLEQLTFGPAQEKTSSPFIWKAPEFGGDDVLLVTANDATEVRIYRQLDKSKPEWSVIHHVQAPVAGTKLSSAEPFVFDGKSYVFMSGVVPPNNFPSAIFLSNIDPLQPWMRQLTPDSPAHTRADPEVFITSTGPYIYFYRADRASTPPLYEGIYRSDTGLRAQ